MEYLSLFIDLYRFSVSTRYLFQSLYIGKNIVNPSQYPTIYTVPLGLYRSAWMHWAYTVSLSLDKSVKIHYIYIVSLLLFIDLYSIIVSLQSISLFTDL